MSRLLPLVVLWAISTFGFPPPPRAVIPEPLAHPVSRPAPVPQPVRVAQPTTPAPKSADAERLEHLLEAANHLEAAGREQQADEIRRSVHVSATIREKEDRIRELRREIEQLRRVETKFHAQEPRQILVRMCWMEVGRGKDEQKRTGGLSGLGRVVGVNHEAAEPRDVTPRIVTIDAKGVESIRTMLREHARSKVVSEPTVITHEGRQAEVVVGGEFPIPVPQPDGTKTIEYRQFGQSAEIVPTVDEDGNFQLAVNFEVSERDFSRATTVDGIEVPGLNTSRVQVTTKVAPERAAILVAPHSDGRTRLLFLEPSIVEPQDAVEAPTEQPVPAPPTIRR